jgi:AcrB/AcrD/AcrF family
MRPIAMTTFAAILALLPLALGLGQGSSMLKPLAIAIISGLVFQLPLVLIVLPSLLALFRYGPSGAPIITRTKLPLVSSERYKTVINGSRSFASLLWFR